MAIYAMGDVHLSCAREEKTMEIFRGWENYQERIRRNWLDMIKPEDTVVLAGDISWALKLEEAEPDFRYLESLPGTKLLMKGNHDYWWNTRKKIEDFFAAKGLKSLKILYNNAVCVEGKALCGSRGWIFENGEAQDEKVIEREAGRIALSLADAPEGMEKILFLHYPPAYGGQDIGRYFRIMEQYGVKRCYYGHLHGNSIAGAVNGEYQGVKLQLISADYLRFYPMLIE